MMHAAQELDFVRIINAARLELESAGNPSYVVMILGAGSEAQISPMVFSTVGPAADHAVRVGRTIEPGEQMVIVSRSAGGQRAVFTVVEPKTLKRMHQRNEVIEQSFAEIDRPI
jgi:hypothetical protein